jgi:seryl-tRNA synthetase
LCQQQYSDREIVEQSAKVRSLSDEVRDLESQVKETKGELTAAKERHDSAVRELQGMIEDRGRGQRRLALGLPAVSAAASNGVAMAKTEESPQKTEETPTITSCVINGDTKIPAGPDEHAASPISVLAQKQMIKLVGQDAWQAAKDKEEPFGLAKGELEILETAEIATVGDLEKRMREDAWWHKKLPKMGEKKIAKLVETLRVWRTKFPMPA